MKKTLTVNLGGVVFQIDEDAYNLLENYLNNLRYHFRKEEGGEEIVRDMETRISELFSEGMEGGQQVITIDNVESVIARMGRPEELGDESGDDNVSEEQSFGKESETARSCGADRHENSANTADTTTEGDGKNSHKVEKRLFRDTDHSVLGGVLGGIAAYFGWDPTALRLVYIILGLLPGGPSVLIIYLILLFIVPPARTATEKLQMRGEPISVENIGKTVTDGFEREKHPNAAENHRTGWQNFFDMIISIVGILVKVLIGILCIICLPILFIGFIVLFPLILSVFGVFIHLPSICWEVMPNIPWDNITSSPVTGIFFLMSTLLIIGIPLMAVIQVILQHFGHSKPMSTGAKLTMVLFWFVSLIVCFISFFIVSTL